MEFIKRWQIKRVYNYNCKTILEIRKELEVLQDVPNKAKEADELMKRLVSLEKRTNEHRKLCERLGIIKQKVGSVE